MIYDITNKLRWSSIIMGEGVLLVFWENSVRKRGRGGGLPLMIPFLWQGGIVLSLNQEKKEQIELSSLDEVGMVKAWDDCCQTMQELGASKRIKINVKNCHGGGFSLIFFWRHLVSPFQSVKPNLTGADQTLWPSFRRLACVVYYTLRTAYLVIPGEENMRKNSTLS